MQPIKYRHVRVYDSLRSAHLERAHDLAPATIVFARKNYDFDESLADGLDLVHAPRLFDLGWVLLNCQIDILEINEPLMLSGSVRAALAAILVKARAAGRGSNVRAVTYAIENRNPLNDPQPPRLRSRPRWQARRTAARLLTRRLDRIAFGTYAARENYAVCLGSVIPPQAETSTILALPAPCACSSEARDAMRVVFLGDLSDRKGFPLVLAAWSHLRSRAPSATLTIIGKGEQRAVAEDYARRHEEVQFIEDPPRWVVHQSLRRARVVALPSQASPGWREQIGLPIVEGLAHGCIIATSEQTGMATWLAARGHAVLDESHLTPREFGRALGRLLEAGPSAEEVAATLPSIDGRVAADEWLFADPSSTSKT